FLKAPSATRHYTLSLHDALPIYFSMWGNDGYVNPGLTPYIVEFLLDAREGGFRIPDNVLQKALKRLNEDLLAGGNEFYGRDHRRSEEHTSELQSRENLVCRLLLE